MIIDAEEFAFIKLAVVTDTKWNHLVFHAVISPLKWCGKMIFMRTVHSIAFCMESICLSDEMQNQAY